LSWAGHHGDLAAAPTDAALLGGGGANDELPERGTRRGQAEVAKLRREARTLQERIDKLELLKRARIRAATDEISFQALLISALDAELGRREKIEARRARVEAVHAPRCLLSRVL
jgi:hypothetical protein